MTHPLDEGTKLDAVEEGVWQGQPSEPYKNMVGPFGGFVSAVFMRSVLEDPRVMGTCLLYTSPSPRDLSTSRMPSSA